MTKRKPNNPSREVFEASILHIANDHRFVVHRYGNAHALFRKTTKRMAKEGRLVMVAQNKRSFYYLSPAMAELEAAEREFTLTQDPIAEGDQTHGA